MSNVNGPRGYSFSTPSEFPRGDQETAKEKGDISPKTHRYVQSVWGSSHQGSRKPFRARSIRSVPVLDIKIRGLLKSDHFRDVERALNSGGDIKADRRQLQPDRDEVENILKDIQTKSAKKEVDLDADFSLKLKKHLNDLKTIDLSSPKELAQIIVSTMDDIRDWHFNAGYDKTLITGKQLIDSEGKLRDILSNYSVGNPGVTGQEFITPVRARDDKSVYGSDHTPPSSPVDTGTGASPTLVAKGMTDSSSATSQVTDASTSAIPETTNRGTSPTRQVTNASTCPIPEGVDDSARPTPEGAEDSKSPVGNKAEESGDGFDATSPASSVDKVTETSPTSVARGVTTTGSQTLSVPDDSPWPMPEVTGKSPVGDEAKES
ncbi:hypothetical protein, partial [Endozoicomonas sp. YOMI1]|uniref:hypothetical protein n=1 Tax=Endozoicomonas sp. YOMI1 TaxID=2828739 RepID=UPI0021485F73